MHNVLHRATACVPVCHDGGNYHHDDDEHDERGLSFSTMSDYSMDTDNSHTNSNDLIVWNDQPVLVRKGMEGEEGNKTSNSPHLSDGLPPLHRMRNAKVDTNTVSTTQYQRYPNYMTRKASVDRLVPLSFQPLEVRETIQYAGNNNNNNDPNVTHLTEDSGTTADTGSSSADSSYWSIWGYSNQNETSSPSTMVQEQEIEKEQEKKRKQEEEEKQKKQEQEKLERKKLEQERKKEQVKKYREMHSRRRASVS